MRAIELMQCCCLAVAISTSSVPGPGQTRHDSALAQRAGTSTEPDGQHDFDFLFGSWKVHCRRLLHPLSGSNEWVMFEGTNVVHPMWDGRATVDEFEADAPSGHVEGMTIRIYNNKSHQWSIYWSSQANGTVDFPPMVGGFRDGRGEFYDAEMYNGKAIFVRFVWAVQSPNSCHWEQAFSADGGKNWETNFIWDLTREK
jgi:hypothetical protein